MIQRTCGVVLTLILFAGQQSGAQSSSVRPNRQALLASALRTGTDSARRVALEGVLLIKPGMRSPALQSALLSALRQRSAMLADRDRRYSAGEQLEPLPEDEYESRLVYAVGQSHDPRVVAPLCEFLSRGDAVMVRVAKFGELAVPPLTQIAADRNRRADFVESALQTLAFMLRMPSDHPVSRPSRLLIAQIARRRLTEPQPHEVIVGSAAEVAFALPDSALIARVTQLGRQESEIRALGITDALSLKLLKYHIQLLLTKGPRAPMLGH